MKNEIPEHWIIREITERDYGIDAYIELVTNEGQVSGELCSVQLKSSSNINWNENDKVRFSGIKKEIVNYWINSPVPVFLFWADLSVDKLYFASVKKQVRNQYDKYNNEKIKTMGFNFYKTNRIDNRDHIYNFLDLYFKEKNFNKFKNYLRGLLIHHEEYYEFIIYNQGRDFFLSVEEKRKLMMNHIYKTCKFLSHILDINWEVISLSDAYKEDVEIWNESDYSNYKSSYGELHEYMLTRIMKEIEPIFIDILEKSKKLIINKQKNYWQKVDYFLYNFVFNLNIDELKKSIK